MVENSTSTNKTNNSLSSQNIKMTTTYGDTDTQK